MHKALQAKKNHHYVWAEYLRRWACEKDNVYCLTEKGKIRYDPVTAMLKDDYFYKTKDLSPNDVQFILAIQSRTPLYLQEIHAKWISHFLMRQDLGVNYRQSGIKIEGVDQALHALSCNELENIHAAHEKAVLDVMEELAHENLEVLETKENWRAFTTYLGQQITRTKRMRDGYFSSLHSQKRLPLEQVQIAKQTWWLQSLLLGINVGGSLYLSRDSMNLSMLINRTSIPFITSDHPVVNVHECATNVHPTSTDIYYPISPRLAITLCDSMQFSKGKHQVDDLTADHLNRMVAAQANKHIVGDSDEILKAYKKLVGSNAQKYNHYVSNL